MYGSDFLKKIEELYYRMYSHGGEIQKSFDNKTGRIMNYNFDNKMLTKKADDMYAKASLKFIQGENYDDRFMPKKI
jgi:prophage maintenance system killer protein